MKEYYNIEMVAVIKDINDKTIGFRIVDGTVPSDCGKRPIKDVSMNNMLITIQKNPNLIHNLGLSNGEVVGTNGKIERYAELVLNNNKEISLKSNGTVVIILGKINDKYLELCDFQGNCLILEEDEVIKWVCTKRCILANATMVTNTDNTKYIRSLNGAFKNVKRKIKENSSSKDTKKENVSKPEDKVEVKQEKEISNNKEKSAEIKAEKAKEYKLNTELLDGELVVVGIEPEAYNGVIVIPKEVKRIGLDAFKNRNISGVIMEDGVVDIGKGSFYNCRNLCNVRVSNNAAFISALCFSKCTSLSKVILGNKVKRIHDSAFEGCTQLESIEIPKQTQEIASSAFRSCKKLKEIKHQGSIERIGQSAFRGCKELEKFEFKGVYSIGSHSFRGTALKEVHITSDTYNIGNYAFYNCRELKNVEIDENVYSLGCGAFNDDGTKDDKHIENILLPKSLTEIDVGAFNNNTVIHVYYGTASESFCKTFDLDIVYRDKLDENNSLKARRKANMLGLDGAICKKIRLKLDNSADGVSNPEYKVLTDKLIGIELTDEIVRELGIEDAKNQEFKEPKIKFKAMCNLLATTNKINGIPLTPKVFRFRDTLDITNILVYSDGYNRIYRISYKTIDILKEGVYWLVLQGNKCIYITELTSRNDFKCYNSDYDNDAIPIGLLRTGDSLGLEYSISGETSRTSYDDELGVDLLERIERNAISIKIDSKNKMYYIPALDKTICIVDEREYDKDGKLKRGCSNRIKVKEIINYEQFISKVSKIKKANMNYSDYFNDLRIASDAYAKYMSELIKIVPEEKVSQLYEVAKQYENDFGSNNVDVKLNKNIVEGIMNSYWVVEKDIDWFNSVGNKSLNKVNVYDCGEWSITEYRSNQVIKFNNPYISGGKDAYVLVITNGNMILKVLSSDRTFKRMVEDLKQIITYDKSTNVPEIMTEAGKYDRVNRSLFYDFYDVVYSKNGWSMNNVKYNQYSTYIDYDCYEFHISMYKPTGVMYLTTSVYKREMFRTQSGKEGSKYARYVVPLFKIGDLDRALYVAATTNTKAKDTKLKEELVYLVYAIKQDLNKAKFEELKSNRQYLYETRYKKVDDVYTRYTKARQLTIDGVSDISKYNMIDERLIWMIGTKASRNLKVADRIYSLSKYDLNINK